MRLWSIRWRLTALNALILTLLFAALCAVMLYLVHGHLRQETDRWLMEELTELIEDVRTTPNPAALQEYIDRRYAIHANLHFRVRRGEMVLFRSRYLENTPIPGPASGSPPGESLFTDIELPEIGRFRLLSIVQPESSGEGPLLFQVMSPQASMGREFRWYVGTVLAAIPIALIIAIATGYGLARQALAPVDHIAATAERISAERLQERIEVRNPHDELGRLATTLNAMFSRLLRSIDQMRRFTSEAAHELRSPIAALRTQAEVVLRAPREPETYRGVLQKMADEAARLTELVNQLLTLSRHDAGQVTPLEDRVRVDLVILDVAERFRERAEEQRLGFSVEPLPAWIVVGDDVLLSQLFYNLFDNALKYTPAEGTVRVSGDISGELLVVRVQDTGIGIPDEVRDRVFDRFFRVDPSQNGLRSGAGLGLAICRAVVETHRGAIEVTSAIGQGSCFQVTFPGTPDREPEAGDDLAQSAQDRASHEAS